MKELTIAYSHMVRRIYIDDLPKADAAYAAMKKALEDHVEWSNDKRKTIELDYGHTAETILIGSVASVSLSDMDDAEASILRRAVWEKRLEAKVAAALQPAAE